MCKGTVPYEQISTKDKHFTVMGLTLLTGQPLMCVVILTGTHMKSEIEMGVDMFSETVGNPHDPDYVSKNSGKGKRFPGGPECVVNDTVVPCFIRWSESGSMTSKLLKEVFQTLDHYDIFPRVDGILPFSLLDAHGSLIELPFLQYVNTIPNEWVVNIGTPYGTSYWKVGDSKEQNGSFKIALTRAKHNLLAKNATSNETHHRDP